MSKPLFKKVALSVIMPIAFVGVIEVILMIAGVEKSTFSPISIRGQESLEAKVSPTDKKVLLDPELLWAFMPGVEWDKIMINEHGFRTRAFKAQKPSGRMRVISLGDSCTAQGRPPYSDRLHALLQAGPLTSDSWGAFNMGVFGYSIMQGLQQFRRDGLAYEPDVVTIYFGWNDHWLHEKTDAARMAKQMDPWKAFVVKVARNLRMTSALVKLGQEMAGQPAPGKTFRVPEEDYRRAMRELVEEIRSINAVPIIITAPRRELTVTLVKTGHAIDPDHAEEAHDRYVEITRSVASEMNVAMIDLAAEFSDTAFDGYFSKDGIHFEDDGLQAIAERIYRELFDMFSGQASHDHS